MSTKRRETRLYFTGDGHDKEYMLQAWEDVGKPRNFVIAYWGPRGRVASNHQVKYEGPSVFAADAVYEKLLAEKTKKGYTSNPAGEPGSFVDAAVEDVFDSLDDPFEFDRGHQLGVSDAAIDRAIEEGRNERA